MSLEYVAFEEKTNGWWQRDSERHRETERDIERQRDKETERQKERKKERSRLTKWAQSMLHLRRRRMNCEDIGEVVVHVVEPV